MFNLFQHGGAGEKTQRLVWLGAVTVSAGMVLVSVFLAYSGPPDTAPQVGPALTLFLVYAAAISVGAFLGFLFGLPRARAVDQVTSVPSTSGGGGNDAPLVTHFLANSNLIKVSDWLTTIIIGLTLVNLGEVAGLLRTAADFLDAPLGGHPYSAAMGLSVAVGSVLAGFVLGYLWTSIRVRQLLEEAENGNQALVADFRGKTITEAKKLAATEGITLDVAPGTDDAAIVLTQQPEPGDIRRAARVRVGVTDEQTSTTPAL